jgi:hypothetical protein
MATSTENPNFLVETVRALITKRRIDAWEKLKRGAGNLLERSHAEEENQTEEGPAARTSARGKEPVRSKAGTPTDNKTHEPQIQPEGRGNIIKQGAKSCLLIEIDIRFLQP